MTRRITVIVEGCKYTVEVGDLRERPVKATINQKTYAVQVIDPKAESDGGEAEPAAAGRPGLSGDTDCTAISAPMPGDILEVNVRPGQSVSLGDPICVLEAMKMRNVIRSSRAGVIATVDVDPGQSVDYGAVLVTFK